MTIVVGVGSGDVKVVSGIGAAVGAGDGVFVSGIGAVVGAGNSSSVKQSEAREAFGGTLLEICVQISDLRYLLLN